MSMKDDYFAMMVSRFKRWDAEFGMLREKCEQLGDAADGSQAEGLKAMRARRDAAYRKLQEIRTAGDSAWRGLQSVVDAAWIVIRTALDDAAARARK